MTTRQKSIAARIAPYDKYIVGGAAIAGAVSLGAYLISVLGGSLAIGPLNDQLVAQEKDYLQELNDFAKADGPNGLTQTHRDTLDLKAKNMQQIIVSIQAAAAQGQISIQQTIQTLIGDVAIVAIAVLGPPAWARAIKTYQKNNADPRTGSGRASMYQAVEAVFLADTDALLAQGFFNNTLVPYNALLQASFLTEQQTIQANLQNLTGLELIQAQIELSAIANDIAAVSIIESLTRVLIFP